MSLKSEQFEIRDSLAITPQLQHSHSKQSVAASEDYYSLSERESVGDENELLVLAHRFSTPPSRFDTPEDDIQTRGSEQATEALRDEKHFRRKAVGSGGPKEFASAAEQKSLAWEKDFSNTENKARAMDPIQRGLTPGQDDSPFIRFAIDQLTRDEEVRGSRSYPVQEEGPTSSTTSEELPAVHPYQNYPTTLPPASPPANRGRKTQTPHGIRAVTPEPLIIPPIASSSRPYNDPTLRPYDDAIDEIPVTPDPVRRERERRLAEQKEMQAGPAPQHPLEGQGTFSESSASIPPPSENDVFVAFNPIRPTTQQPRLNFTPGILRPLWLGLFMFFCVLMLTGLLFCAIWCLKHDGLWQYDQFGDNRYFVFEYLPTLFGMIILVWLMQIEIAVIRIAPFIAMASTSMKSRSTAQLLNLYPTQFLFPKIEYFRSGQPILGVCFVIFWLFLFTIPLLSSSFNVQFFGPTNAGIWRWVAVQGVIWTVIVLYILLILALILLLVELRRSETGLKWDPRSLADLIALVERSNFLNEYTGTEIYTHVADFRQRLWNSTPRLGYWHTSHRPNDIFYGLGEEGGLTRRYSIEQGRIREKGHKYHSSIDSHEDLELGDQSRVQLNYRHSVVRRRYIPWFLSSSSILAWILIAFVLLVAFYVVAFVNQATTGHGFLPDLDASTDSSGFSPANFLYSFVPGMIGFLLYLSWLPLDLTYRRLEPYRTMATAEGSIAEHSLLLDYPFRLPGSVTLAAVTNGHWKIALVSFLSIVNITIPILSGGIFWAQWYTGATEVRISAEPAGLYALCVFLALYAVGLIAFVPNRKSLRMPHDSKCLAEVVSWLYQSPILLDRAFARCQTKTELQTRLLGERAAHPTGFWASVTNLVHSFSREGLRGRAALDEPKNHKAKAVLGADPPSPRSMTDAEKRGSVNTTKARYAFGVYTGRDGRDHLGIDKVGRGMVLFDD